MRHLSYWYHYTTIYHVLVDGPYPEQAVPFLPSQPTSNASPSQRVYWYWPTASLPMRQKWAFWFQFEQVGSALLRCQTPSLTNPDLQVGLGKLGFSSVGTLAS